MKNCSREKRKKKENERVAYPLEHGDILFQGKHTELTKTLALLY